MIHLLDAFDICAWLDWWVPRSMSSWAIFETLVFCLFSLGLWIRSTNLEHEKDFWRWFPQRLIEPLGLMEVFLSFAAVACGMGISRWFLDWFPAETHGVVVGCGALLGCVAGFLLLLPQSIWIKNWFHQTELFPAQEMATGILRVCLVMPWLLIFHSVLTNLTAPYRHETLDVIQGAESSVQIFSAWFGALIVAPVTEEFLFRGVLLYGIAGMAPGWYRHSRNLVGDVILGNLVNLTPQKRSVCDFDSTDGLVRHNQPGVLWGILGSSALFSLSHWNNGLSAAVTLFFLGVFLSWLFLKSRSLWPCIAAHLFFNFHTLFWQTLQRFAESANSANQ